MQYGRSWRLPLRSLYIYMYIYIHTYIHTYIYTYRYIDTRNALERPMHVLYWYKSTNTDAVRSMLLAAGPYHFLARNIILQLVIQSYIYMYIYIICIYTYIYIYNMHIYIMYVIYKERLYIYHINIYILYICNI